MIRFKETNAMYIPTINSIMIIYYIDKNLSPRRDFDGDEDQKSD